MALSDYIYDGFYYLRNFIHQIWLLRHLCNVFIGCQGVWKIIGFRNFDYQSSFVVRSHKTYRKYFTSSTNVKSFI